MKIKNKEMRLKRVMKEFTQQRLGEEVGIPRSVISLIEVGKYQASLKVACKLAEVLDMDPCDFILEREGNKNESKDRE